MKQTITAALVALALTSSVVHAEDDKPDPRLERTYAMTTQATYIAMARAIAGKWVIGHTDKDICLISFEQKGGMTTIGNYATATCEELPDGKTLVRIKARQKGDGISFGFKERGFVKDVFKEFDKAGLK